MYKPERILFRANEIFKEKINIRLKLLNEKFNNKKKYLILNIK